VTGQIPMRASRSLTSALVVYLAALSLTASPAAATPAASSQADRRLVSAASASDQRRKRLEAHLAAAVRDFHRDADRAIRDPTSPIERIGFTTEKFLMDALIRSGDEAAVTALSSGSHGARMTPSGTWSRSRFSRMACCSAAGATEPS
jgi:hypothetical protein